MEPINQLIQSKEENEANEAKKQRKDTLKIREKGKQFHYVQLSNNLLKIQINIINTLKSLFLKQLQFSLYMIEYARIPF